MGGSPTDGDLSPAGVDAVADLNGRHREALPWPRPVLAVFFLRGLQLQPRMYVLKGMGEESFPLSLFSMVPAALNQGLGKNFSFVVWA